MRRLKKTTWVIIALSCLVVGFWWNLQALWAYTHDLPSLKIFGDILPFKLSVGDCFLFVGYAIFVILLAVLVAYLIVGLILKVKRRSKEGE